jgi:hypothetical protein
MNKLELAKKAAEDALDCARDAQLTALFSIKHSNSRDTINALMSDMRKQQLLADDALLAYQQIKQEVNE